MFRVSVVKDVLQMRLAVTGVVNTFIWLMCSVLQTSSRFTVNLEKKKRLTG